MLRPEFALFLFGSYGTVEYPFLLNYD